MPAITFVEAVKLALNRGETKRAGVIATFARTSTWLANLPFRDIPGSAYAYDQEQALPGIAFRGINEAYTASAGVINPETESLRIAGGDLDVDVASIKMNGPGVRTVHETMKIKQLAASLTTKLIKGDVTSDVREFDGLQKRISTSGSQFVSAGTTDAGDALSLFKLDELVDKVSGMNKQLWMNKAMRRRMSQAARTTTVGGYIEWVPGQFGAQVLQYNGIPIYDPYPDDGGTEPLAFDEQGDLGGTPGGASSTSVYCVGLGDGYLTGIQNGVMEVRDLGELDTQPTLRTRVEWLVGLVVEHPRCIARYGGISNAPVVA